MFFQRSIVEIYGVSFVVFSCYFFSVAVSVLFRYKTKTIVTGYFDIGVNNSRPSDSQAVEQRLRSGNKSRRRRMSGSL